MRKLLCSALIFVMSLFLSGRAQDSQVQKSTGITGAGFLKMYRYSRGRDVDRALDCIGTIYGPKLNNGVTPDHETLYVFGEILEKYLIDNPASQTLPIEELVLRVLNNGQSQVDEQKIFWDRAYKTAEAYFEQPSSENAEKLYLALPDKRLPWLEFRAGIRFRNFIFWGRSFSILEKNMNEGEPHAVDIGFRLFNMSNGTTGEILANALGEIVPRHPRLFLQKLLAHRFKTEPSVFELLDRLLDPISRLSEVPGNIYAETSNPLVWIRIKALKSVNDPDLKEIRDLCIARLKKMVRSNYK